MMSEERGRSAACPEGEARRPDLSRLLDAVLMVGTDLNPRATHQRIVEAAIDLVGARCGALGVLDESGEQFLELITVGADSRTRATIGNLPKRLAPAGPRIGDVNRLSAADLNAHPRSSDRPLDQNPETSFLGVPILVSGTVFANLYLTHKATNDAFTAGDEELTVGFAVAAGIAIENARRWEEGRRREAGVVAINAIAAAVLAGADRRSSLELVARHAGRLLDADVTSIALADATGRDLVMEIADGPGAEGLRNARFMAEGTIAGDVLVTGQPVVVDDASGSDGIHPRQLRAGLIGPVLFLPLVADGRSFGTLTVARTKPATPFTAADVTAARSFATNASVVLQHERVREDLQQLTLLEDQERIGRDLHDTVIQRLYATGLELQSTLHLITEPAARHRIAAAVDELDRTIAHIRTVIFDIELSHHDGVSSARAAILDMAHTAARGLGFEPVVTFSGPVDTMITGHLLSDLLATIEEALSNATRHAHATRLDVELGVGDHVTLRVVDDGIGIAAARDRRAGHGLLNMRARAERHGGVLDIRSYPGGGTDVRWRVPTSAIATDLQRNGDVVHGMA